MTIANIQVLSSAKARAALPDLCTVLIDCVEDGASVNFLAPMTIEKARAYWLNRCFPALDAGEIILIAAMNQGQIQGTIQVMKAPQENQAHRADIAKLLVRPSSRRTGLGARLLAAAEQAALAANRTLLVLDTEEGSDAERLYARSGWTRLGVIPDYATRPDGRLIGSAYYFKSLAARMDAET